MENNNTKYDNIGKNIKGLRTAYGQSLLDLALDIGIGVSAISQYENGKRIPERDILVKIAKHFRITENELLFSDFSNFKISMSIPVNNTAYNIAIIEKLLPLLSSDEAMKNDDFANAYNIHTSLFDQIIENRDLDDSQFNTCIELYKSASKKGILDASANILWWIVFKGMIYSFYNPRLFANIESLHGRETTLKEIINCYLYSTEDEEDDEYIAFQKEKTEFVQENIIDLLVNIALLKNSKTHATLGDFYLALAYIFTLLINDMSPEMNSAIGVEMMHIFDILGNPYAQNALTLLTDTNGDE